MLSASRAILDCFDSCGRQTDSNIVFSWSYAESYASLNFVGCPDSCGGQTGVWALDLYSDSTRVPNSQAQDLGFKVRLASSIIYPKP